MFMVQGVSTKLAESRSTAESDGVPENLTELLNGRQILSDRALTVLGCSLLGIGISVGLTVRCARTGAAMEIARLFNVLGRWATPHVAKPFERKYLKITIPTVTVLIAAHLAYVVGRQYFSK